MPHSPYTVKVIHNDTKKEPSPISSRASSSDRTAVEDNPVEPNGKDLRSPFADSGVAYHSKTEKVDLWQHRHGHFDNNEPTTSSADRKFINQEPRKHNNRKG